MSTMSLIDAHLESIRASAQSIKELQFQPTGIFTNALLGGHEITSLIRDTETHERALFSVQPSEPLKAHDASVSRRRTTVYASKAAQPGVDPQAARAPRRNTAVATVLGKDLVEKIRKGHGMSAGSGLGYQSYERGRAKDEIDVEALLEGAEKLANVYPIPGTAEKIASLRQRHRRLLASIMHYEGQIGEQSSELSALNRQKDYSYDSGEDQDPGTEAPTFEGFTKEDMQREQDEIDELEQKKRVLEERVSGMERDISGVTR